MAVEYKLGHLVVAELAGPKVTSEATFNRMRSHMMGGPFALLTAWRRDALTNRKDNEANMRKLGTQLQQMGYSYKQVVGQWPSEISGQMEKEYSLFVIGISEEDAHLLGNRFNQDSVLWGTGKGDTYLIHKNGTKERIGGNPTTTDVEDYFTRLRSKKFSFSEGCSFRIIPDGMSEGLAIIKEIREQWIKEVGEGVVSKSLQEAWEKVKGLKV